MPLTISCPKCQARYRLPEGSEGKKVKCQKCGEKFTVALDGEDDVVEEVGIAPVPAPKGPTKKSVPVDDEEDERPARRRSRRDDDEEDENERPRGRRDEDDEDERPRRRRDDDEDEDDEDDRPRRRRKKRKQSSSNTLLIVGGIVLGVFVLCGGGAGFLFWSLGRAVNKVGKEIEKQIAIEQARDQNEAKFLDANAKIEVAGGGNEVAFDAGGNFTHNNHLTNNDPLMAGKHYKLYLVPMEKDQTYQIDMTSGEIDPFLRLLGPDGRVLAQDDDSGNDLNARLVYRATESGKHKVIATSFDLADDPNARGPFTLAVRRTAGGPPAAGVPPGPGPGLPPGPRAGRGGPRGPLGPAPALPKVEGYAPGTAVTLKADGTFSVAGSLGAGEPTIASPDPWLKGKHNKVFLVPLEQGKTYQIDMIATGAGGRGGLDSFLFLLNTADKTVAMDDDSGGNLNARIRYTAAETGTHKIIATSLVPGMQGAFRLEIRRE